MKNRSSGRPASGVQRRQLFQFASLAPFLSALPAGATGTPLASDDYNPLVPERQTGRYRPFLRITRHDPDDFNRRVSDFRVPGQPQPLTVEANGATWDVQLSISASGAVDHALDLTATFTVLRGVAHSTSISLDLCIADWSAENYVCMPGAVYNGNRFDWRRLQYSPKLYEVQDIGPDKPPLISDIPRLSLEGRPSQIQERSGAMSVPAFGFHDSKANDGSWLLFPQANELGDIGINFWETRDRSEAWLSLTSPVVRERTLYKFMDNEAGSWDAPRTFAAGDRIKISAVVFESKVDDLAGFFAAFTRIRKSAVKSRQTRNLLPNSESLKTIEAKFNAENWVESPGYYSVGLRQNFLQDWQIGWTGGMISTHPLLAAGNDLTKSRVLRMYDWLFPQGISPSGFFWDSGEGGHKWYGGDIRKPHSQNWHLIRKSADAIYMILRQFQLMRAMGVPVKQAWSEGNRTVCDAFVRLWRSNGQLGQFVHSVTGEIIVGGSSSGAVAPAGLCLAAEFYNRPEYLTAAEEIGDYFARKFTLRGLSYGGPGDALQCPDSESSFGLVQSYVALYEATRDGHWLSVAENAANQFSTWVVGYDYVFPQDTAFAKLDIRTTGSVYANAQNKHSAPGICTGSGYELLKLYRLTSQPRYLELVRDIAHNVVQYLSHPLNPIPGQPFGHVSERINLTDWEGQGTIGYVLPLSTWAETSLLMSAVDLPGIYVDPRNANCAIFDHVEARVEINDTQVILNVVNPTKLDCSVSIYIDWDRRTKLNEGYTRVLPRVHLRAGERKRLSYRKPGWTAKD